MKVLLAQLGHWPTWFWRLPFPALSLGLFIFLLPLPLISPQYSRLRTLRGWRLFGIVAGLLLFTAITSHANPAMAQLFDTVESQAQTLFGEYLDSGIIAFIFGVLRIVIWVSAVGFVFFAVYQAQRGEQWQPLLQNAFIIIAAVVIVEGLSRLFFGTA
ncbi:MAG: hypothetical protein AAF722_00180 [Cyanobacteria bacterium P01_C01_bin.70]